MPSSSLLLANSATAQSPGALPEATPGTNYSSPPQHQNRVLASLPAREFALIAPHLHVVSVQAGAFLQEQGKSFEYAYFPHDGLVSLIAKSAGGQAIEAASVGRGGAICDILEIDPPENFLSAISFQTVRLSRMPAARLRSLRRESEAFDRALSACRDSLLVQLRQNVLCNGLHSGEGRLARWLLETADRIEAGVFLSVTHAALARCLGLQRSTLTLLAGSLQEIGAIRCARSRIELLDRARLEERACGCYTTLREHMGLAVPAPPGVGSHTAVTATVNSILPRP